jgi:PDGLE domain
MSTDPHRTDRSRASWLLIALALIASVVIAAAFLASADPDGLERVAEDAGFSDAGQGSPFSVIADYVFPGMDGPAGTIVAGLLGVAVLFGLAWLIGKALARRRA